MEILVGIYSLAQKNFFVLGINFRNQVIKNSIIIPVFNAEEHLALVLETLLKELPEDSEVIVVDDCSSDQSVAIAKTFPVRVLEAPVNRGPSASRNRGVEESSGEILIFIDADVVLEERALDTMFLILDDNPEILGINGLPSEVCPYSDWASDYVNLSLLFQLLGHGTRVNSCFTSLCLLRRAAWMQMDGWDEDQVSRYVDDVQTRWFLPKDSIAQDKSVRFLHYKKVHWRGVMRHRFNIGFHFLKGVPAKESRENKGIQNLTLHRRYPLNTVLALSCSLILLFPRSIWLIILLLVLNNFKFALFIYRKRGMFQAMTIIPLSLLEGCCFLFGMSWGWMYGRT